METCKTCAFYEPVTKHYGRCRRHAPRPVNFAPAAVKPTAIVAGVTLWPSSCVKDWCGEYQPAKAA